MAGTIMGTIGETIERADSQAYSDYMEADGKLESGVALVKSTAIAFADGAMFGLMTGGAVCAVLGIIKVFGTVFRKK